MIARMSKYDLVLYAGQSSDFIEKLRGPGAGRYYHYGVGAFGRRPSVAAFDRQPSQGGRCPDAVSRRRTFRSGRAAHRRRRRGFRSLYGRYAAGSGAPFGDRTLAENRRRAASLGRFFGRYASQVSGQGRGATLFLHQPCGLREGYRSVVGALYDRSGARG